MEGTPQTDGPDQPLILVADDDEDIVSLVSEYLELDGFRVLRARDGREALSLITEHRPALAILDLIMPEMYGYAVLRHARENEETKDMPVIILSARGEEEDVERGFEAGANDYVRKPFGAKDLVARVHAVLERSG